MKTVTKQQFTQYLIEHPELTDQPAIGRMVAAMQYVNADNVVMAQAIYGNPNRPPKVKIIPTYAIRESS
jgi:hypothetical protein